ncbi:MAG: hypothetical protein FJ297_18745 [Planctomycetes bacterium]|nr:hypothetical protein [Planctomycetota bacterium]
MTDRDTRRAVLMALEPMPRGPWLGPVESCLRKAECETRTESGRLTAWRDVRSHCRVLYADGWQFAPIRLSCRRTALAITRKRLYFSGSSIDHRREHEIVAGCRPPDRPAHEQIREQWSILTVLSDNLPLGPRFVPVDLDATLGESRYIHIGGRRLPFSGATLNNSYRQYGFHDVPKDWKLLVCGLDGVEASVVERFRDGLQGVVGGRGAHAKIVLTDRGTIQHRLDELESRGEVSSTQGRCLLFVLPSSTELPSADSLELLARLDRARVPFRRAYATDPINFSIPDQLPSLLLACGGRPHIVCTEAKCGPIWTVAIDLGHAPGRETSTVVATVVGPEGILTHACRAVQRRDETVSQPVLIKLLRSCAEVLGVSPSKDNVNVLVMRDGRLFENEHAAWYRTEFGPRVTLMEYRKRWNPQVILEHGESPGLPGAPFSARLPGAATMFLCTTSPRTNRELPNMVKVTWKEEWNGLELDGTEIARLLTASSAAPGLGQRPHHLPAALYWADGIAGATNDDLRFRGNRVVDV